VWSMAIRSIFGTILRTIYGLKMVLNYLFLFFPKTRIYKE